VLETKKLMTVGTIARDEKIPLHRLNYALASSNIEPQQRAGVIRLFSPDQMDEIRAAIKRTAGTTHAVRV
jgi:hypothetical protein